MVDRRLKLQRDLESIIGAGHVFFQPPEKDKIEHPCIIYHLSDIFLKYANNHIYYRRRVYQLILVDENPDSEYVDLLLDFFENIIFDRFYVSDNLNHWVYNLPY